MTSTTLPSLVDRRHILQRQLQAQRQVIAQQLGPTPGTVGAYPRSLTMRFLIRRSPLITRLAGEFVTLLIGARFMKSITAAMAFSSATRTGSSSN